MLEVHLYRPFSAQHFLGAIPDSVQHIAVLDRTKEAGARAEPLYLDVMTAFAEAYQSGAGANAAYYRRTLRAVIQRI